MTACLRAEWTKLYTLPSTAWLAAMAIAFTVAVSAAFGTTVDAVRCPAASGCAVDTTKISLTGVWVGQVAIVVLAVLAVTNEYASSMIRTTVAAAPRRWLVLLCKASVLLGLTLSAGAIAVGGALVAARGILSSRGFTAANGYPPLSLGDEPTLRAAAGSVLYLALIALLALGVGTLVRDTAGAIAAVLALLYTFPLLASVITNPAWQVRLQRYSPMSAGLSIQSTRGLDELAIGPWAGLGVLAAYAAAAILAGAVAFSARDA